MPLTILPRENPTSNWQSQLGANLGTGLGQGLSALLQGKMQEVNLGKQAKAWESIGLPSNAANFIVRQPEWMQKEIFNRLEGLDFNQQQGPQQQGMQQQQMQQGMPQQAMQQQMQGQAPEFDISSVVGDSGGAGRSPVRIGASAEQKKLQAAEQRQVNKEVFPYITKLQDQASGAKEGDLRLKKMEKLIQSGKLNSPGFSSLLKTFKKGIHIPMFGGGAHIPGIDLTSLLTPESQEFDKLSSDFIKNAKDVFGSRITDRDLDYFLQTIPNLSQTNQGKAAVIRNLQLMNQGVQVKSRAARELLKYYKGRPPIDFKDQVERLAEPSLNKIAEEFEQILPQDNTAGTRTVPVDVLGAPGKLLLGNQ